MNFMKVLDQTLREIKREVNLRVLKVPEIEQKVLDATSDEPWGPHGSALAEIAQATKNFTEFQIIMDVLWARLTDTSQNWRHIYKALAVIEYLVAHGSERAVDDILGHSFHISSLSGFEYVEANGKDFGINVTKKVETIMALLNDREKIAAARNKAATNREKYFGLSSTGITCMSSSASFGSRSFQHNDCYGGLGGGKEVETFKSDHKDTDQNGYGNHQTHYRRNPWDKSKQRPGVKEGTSLKMGQSYRRSNSEQISVKRSSRRRVSFAPKSLSTETANPETEFDDFNPRGASTSELDDFDPRGSSTSAAAGVKQVDISKYSLLGSLMDASASSAAETDPKTGTAYAIDLFADANFVSPPGQEAPTGSSLLGQIDLFAMQPTMRDAASASNDLFSKPNSSTTTEPKPVIPAAPPLHSPRSSDLFGDFTSHLDSAKPESLQIASNDHSPDRQNPSAASTSTESKPTTKATFRVKSSIWADSLSRGLIDLDLSSPKKVSLKENPCSFTQV